MARAARPVPSSDAPDRPDRTATALVNVALLAGTVRSEPLGRVLDDGRCIWSFDLHTADGSVPVAWSTAAGAPAPCVAGVELVVAGVVRRRFFRAGGATQSRTEVDARAVVEVTARRPRARAAAVAVGALDDSARQLLRAATGAEVSARGDGARRRSAASA